MKLRDWLKTERMSAARLSRELDVSKVSVSHWVKDVIKPGRAKLEEIKRITKGAVSESDFSENQHCPWCKRSAE